MSITKGFKTLLLTKNCFQAMASTWLKTFLNFGLGFRPIPHWGSLQCFHRPLAGEDGVCCLSPRNPPLPWPFGPCYIHPKTPPENKSWLQPCLPLLLFPCTIKSRSSLLAPAHLGGPGKGAVKRLCVCVCVLQPWSYDPLLLSALFIRQSYC